ncbi:MAG: flagellar basal body-associated FliL family protein [Aquificaceae bacterium]|nr:flagellar basal body-associated FliL family protein [Aquificaceae bacterium]MCS7196308.1 flagellar basal body-associated FliL family protein [Aquificaceae bacterium]MCX7989295.1 flagellar basal body-associated FliL family protein [Aquificaceae bacterium]MDW8032047.1 flagellar basal body-associated protein FliL [Aquificaceae bacterium]MDW8294878.1 flagellar basal body-associated protein FliL [Aquificaceae bacterium]
MAEEAREEKKGGSKKFLFIIPLLLLFVAGGGGAYFFLFAKKGKKEESAPPPTQVGVMMELGVFTVNLADRNVDAFARVAVTLELSNEKARQEVERRLPIIKDAIIDVISSKTSSFVRTPEGRENLRLELIRRINTILFEGGVRNIYFTEFVVQTT